MRIRHREGTITHWNRYRPRIVLQAETIRDADACPRVIVYPLASLALLFSGFTATTFDAVALNAYKNPI